MLLILMTVPQSTKAQSATPDTPLAALQEAKCKADSAARDIKQEMDEIRQQKEKVGDQMMREGVNDDLERQYAKLANAEIALSQTLEKYRVYLRAVDKVLPVGTSPCP